VMDTFRQPKPAAGFFRSQCSPQEEAVLEPGFHFAENDEPGGFKNEIICSNCDEIQCSIVHNGAAKPIVRLKPAHDQFPHLAHPPFFLTLPDGNDDWGDLRLEGYVSGKLVISKTLSCRGIDQKFTVIADDEELVADGSDATRVSLRITDEYGAIRPLCTDPIAITLEGPGVLLGETLVALSGGATAVWVKTTTVPGDVVLTARHAHFGERKVTIRSRPAPTSASPGAGGRTRM
jgi:beta-galactosidase